MNAAPAELALSANTPPINPRKISFISTSPGSVGYEPSTVLTCTPDEVNHPKAHKSSFRSIPGRSTVALERCAARVTLSIRIDIITRSRTSLTGAAADVWNWAEAEGPLQAADTACHPRFLIGHNGRRRTIMGMSDFDPGATDRRAWNAGRKVGAKRALKPRQV